MNARSPSQERLKLATQAHLGIWDLNTDDGSLWCAESGSTWSG